MFDIFTQLRSLIKDRYTTIDSHVFTLHYRITVLLLILCAFVVGTNKYFGNPIECAMNDDKFQKYTNAYCWFNSYIRVPRDPDDDYSKGEFPAISNFETANDLKTNKKFKPFYQHAYQWVEFLLCIQAVLFFFPRYLWRYCWENGRVKMLTEKFNPAPTKEEEVKQKINEVVQYFIRNRLNHFAYSCKYIVCEFLNFGNVLVQFLILNKTLGLSARVLYQDFITSESNHDWSSKVARVFPNLARCDLKIGMGAGNSILPQLCVLPINVFTAKLYIMLWFYFLVVVIITGLSVVYRGLTVFIPYFRLELLKREAGEISNDSLTSIRSLSFGNWFILHLVGKNMDEHIFKNLLIQYNEDLMDRRPSFDYASNRKLLREGEDYNGHDNKNLLAH